MPPPLWEPPTPEVAALIRDCAERLIDDPQPSFDMIIEAVSQLSLDGAPDDPLRDVNSEQSLASVFAQWVQSNVDAPGMPVEPDFGPDLLNVTRDVVRRGWDDQTANFYRIGHVAALRHLTGLAFELSDDVQVLREALDLMWRSSSQFVDDVVAGILSRINAERAHLTGGRHARQLQTVTAILDGTLTDSRLAADRLGYELDRRLIGAVLWVDSSETQLATMSSVIGRMAAALGSRRPLTIMAATTSQWVWLGMQDSLYNRDALQRAVTASHGVSAAIGPAAFGLDGFRRSHLGAMTAQRVMLRMQPDLRFATYEDIRLVALAGSDEVAALEFVRQVLGDLATAEPVLRDTLLAVIRQGFNTARAAALLHAHRNTVLNRTQRAEALLPEGLSGRVPEIAVALELANWLPGLASRSR